MIGFIASKSAPLVRGGRPHRLPAHSSTQARCNPLAISPKNPTQPDHSLSDMSFLPRSRHGCSGSERRRAGPRNYPARRRLGHKDRNGAMVPWPKAPRQAQPNDFSPLPFPNGGHMCRSPAGRRRKAGPVGGPGGQNTHPGEKDADRGGVGAQRQVEKLTPG